jgi:hypothetical protein
VARVTHNLGVSANFRRLSIKNTYHGGTQTVRQDFNVESGVSGQYLFALCVPHNPAPVKMSQALTTEVSETENNMLSWFGRRLSLRDLKFSVHVIAATITVLPPESRAHMAYPR